MERLTNSRLEKCCDYFVSFGSKEAKREYRELAEDAPKYEQLYKRLAEYEKIGTVEEFKSLRDIDEDLRLKYCYEDLSSADNSGYMRGYAKAIDEFVNLVNECSGYTPNCIEHDLSLTVYTIHQIAEQLKG